MSYEYVPWDSRRDFSDLVGKTLTAITVTHDTINFFVDNGESYRMYHDQDCCETVYIDDICGDLQDLIGNPILAANEVSNLGDGPKDEYEESYTWTFYSIRNIKASVDIRWYGASNGYYSESVTFAQIDKPATVH